VSLPNRDNNGGMPVYIAYPKGSNYKNSVIIGWNWTPHDIDVKAFKFIKDGRLKQSVIDSIKRACIQNNLHYQLGEDLSEVVVYKLIPAQTINSDILKFHVLLLMVMFGIIMSIFEKHRLSRADTFDPSRAI
jgi:hypothetical protein